jgi:hypothetical protein
LSFDEIGRVNSNDNAQEFALIAEPLSYLSKPAGNGRWSFAADVPPWLSHADDVLTRYGRWAMDRSKSRRCGSAEGRYRSAPNDDDRQPRELLMMMVDALAAQRALSRVPELERRVLAILYVPTRLPFEARVRMERITPRVCQERHLAGLRIFDNLYRIAIHCAAPDTVSAHRQPIG